MDDKKKESNSLSNEIISAAIEVHRALGPGLLESAYEACLCHELSLREIPYKTQVPISIDYKGICVNNSYRIDLLVDDLIIIEIKSVKKIEPIHEAQLLT